MSRGQGLLLTVLGVGALVVWVVVLGQGLAPDPPARPTSIAEVTPSPVATVESAPASTPTPEPASSEEPPDPATPGVGDGGRPAFLAFLARLDAARVEAAGYTADLREAGEAGDTGAVRSTAAAMRDLVDRERGWLVDNAPDPCYAEAHAAADELLAAYGSVAVAADGWADASGFDVLSALAALYDAVEAAAAEAADLGPVLEDVSCPA